MSEDSDIERSEPVPAGQDSGPVAGDPEPRELETVQFVPQPGAETSVPAEAGIPPARTRPPGPGLPESLAWTFLILLSQFAAAIVVVIVAVIALAIVHRGQWRSDLLDPAVMGPNGFVIITAAPALLAYLVLIPLACLRMRPAPLQQLNFSRPSLTQAIIVSSCVIPLGTISDALFTLVQPWWDRFLEQSPDLSWLRELGLAEHMQHLNGASLPLLLLFLAVVPAIGEEWMLRGLIGRGLLARWGVVPGLILTSLLFAVIHIDPPHVVAVLPIGFMLHVVYLTTRSFWMPVLFHFLNNAIVSVFTSLGHASPEESTSVSWLVYVAPVYIAIAAWCLWKLRTRYVDSGGAPVTGAYFSVAHVPEPQARRIAPNHLPACAVFTVLLAAQVALIGYEAYAAGQRDVPAGEAADPDVPAGEPAALSGRSPWEELRPAVRPSVSDWQRSVIHRCHNARTGREHLRVRPDNRQTLLARFPAIPVEFGQNWRSRASISL